MCKRKRKEFVNALLSPEADANMQNQLQNSAALNKTVYIRKYIDVNYFYR